MKIKTTRSEKGKRKAGTEAEGRRRACPASCQGVAVKRSLKPQAKKEKAIKINIERPTRVSA